MREDNTRYRLTLALLFTALEFAGLAAIVVAAWLEAWLLGLAVLGAVLVFTSWRAQR